MVDFAANLGYFVLLAVLPCLIVIELCLAAYMVATLILCIIELIQKGREKIQMNREQRRDFVKKAKSKGVSKKAAEAYAAILDKGVGKVTPAQPIEEDEQIMLNIESIKARQNYERMSELYKQCVEESSGKVFTAHVERPNLISLKEEPKWLFWSGDLIRCLKTESEVSDD